MNLKFNRSDYILLAIIYGVNFIIEVYHYIIAAKSTTEYLVNIPTGLVTSFAVIYLFITWLIPNYIIKERKYTSFVFLGLILLISYGGINYIVSFWSENTDWNEFPTAFSFTLNAIDLGADNILMPLALLLIKKVYEEQVLLAEQKEKQKDNELKLLRSQIDPHFLFNNLNTLDALIDNNPDRAKEYINRLSLIYRYLIQTRDAEVMELSEELSFAKNYIFLIKTRFGNDYVFEFKERDSVEDEFLPTGAIQALLENVVKHNKKQNETPIKTTISINAQWLSIVNSKSEIKSYQESFGTGLENIRARYKLLSNKEIQVCDTDSEFKISIPIIKLAN